MGFNGRGGAAIIKHKDAVRRACSTNEGGARQCSCLAGAGWRATKAWAGAMALATSIAARRTAVKAILAGW